MRAMVRLIHGIDAHACYRSSEIRGSDEGFNSGNRVDVVALAEVVAHINPGVTIVEGILKSWLPSWDRGLVGHRWSVDGECLEVVVIDIRRQWAKAVGHIWIG